MVTFALSPFLADASTGLPILDYTTKSGKEHYRVATEKLDPETGFALDPNDCLSLLDLFAARAVSMGWDRESGVLWIPDDNGENRYIVSQYAMLTENQVTTAELAVMSAETRSSQESYQIYQCLYNSLT